MASIRHYTNKRGDVTYQIIVSAGSDRIGRQIRHYKTWKPPATMGARDIARELQRIATEFEQDILGGFQIDNKQTFAEYAEYCYSLRVQAGEKPQTLERVKRQTARINEKLPFPGVVLLFACSITAAGTSPRLRLYRAVCAGASGCSGRRCSIAGIFPGAG